MSQESYRGDVLQKIAGLGLIVGGILTVVSNAIFPRADDPSVVAQVLKSHAANETLSQLSYLGITMGVIAIMIGTVGLYRKISTGAAAVFARLGFYGVIVGTALFAISSAVGLAVVGRAVDWVAAGSAMDTSAFSASSALADVSLSMFDMTFLVYWLALIFLAIGMVLSSAYPKWLGWFLLVASIAVVVIAIPRFFMDPTQVTEYVFAVPAGLTSVWALVTGIWITRREIQAM